MSTAAPHGFLHAAATYGSDDELLEVVIPYLEHGFRADELVFAALDDHGAALVRSALPADGVVTFWPWLDRDARPPLVIKSLTAHFEAGAAETTRRFRVVQAVPHPGVGAAWDGWCRYEAAVNDLFAPLPVSGLCIYDRRVTPEAVLGDVVATHPRVLADGVPSEPNSGYQNPGDFLRARPPAPPDPVEAAAPDVELVDPTPLAARHATAAAAGPALPRDDVERLLIAVSEAVTNASAHGRPPVVMRLWATPGRVVVAVTDHGRGPADPYVGLLPAPRATRGQGGYGLWLVEQLVTATHIYTPDAFTLRLVAGAPLPGPGGADER